MPSLRHWSPWLTRLSFATVKVDLLAGITGAVVVLPQGIAYALIAGLPPQYGLYTAIILPIVAGLFGSSYHMVSGPVAPNSVLVAGVLAGMALPGTDSYIALAITLAFLAGLFQLAFGAARLGVLVNFISPSVILGFTVGAAVLIILSQLDNALGVSAEQAKSAWAAIENALEPDARARSLASLLLFALTLCVYFLIHRLRRRWPALLIAMLAVSAGAWLTDVQALGVPMVGAMPAALPPLSVPVVSPTVLQGLVPGALALAALGLVQAVSVSRAIALRSRQRLDSNREFVGQGLSNMVGSFFSCYPGSGSMTRSGLNYDMGARTPLAGVFSSLVLGLILLLAPSASAHLPMPVVAGIIVLIAWGLFDIAAFRHIVRSSREETAVVLATLLGAILVSLEFAIAFGVIFSLIFYLRRTSNPRLVPVEPYLHQAKQGLQAVEQHYLRESADLRILRLDGSLYFGAVENVQQQLQRLTAPPQSKRVLLVCQAVNLIDLAGVDMLVWEAERLAQAGGGLYFCSLREQPRRSLEKGARGSQISSDHIFEDVATAIAALAPNYLDQLAQQGREERH